MSARSRGRDHRTQPKICWKKFFFLAAGFALTTWAVAAGCWVVVVVGGATVTTGVTVVIGVALAMLVSPAIRGTVVVGLRAVEVALLDAVAGILVTPGVLLVSLDVLVPFACWMSDASWFSTDWAPLPPDCVTPVAVVVGWAGVCVVV